MAPNTVQAEICSEKNDLCYSATCSRLLQLKRYGILPFKKKPIPKGRARSGDLSELRYEHSLREAMLGVNTLR